MIIIRVGVYFEFLMDGFRLIVFIGGMDMFFIGKVVFKVNVFLFFFLIDEGNEEFLLVIVKLCECLSMECFFVYVEVEFFGCVGM